MEPRSLQNLSLGSVDGDGLDGPFDDQEPLELRRVLISGEEIPRLSKIPLSVDECHFVGCDLSLVTIVSARNCLFTGSKLAGTVFTQSLRNVVFDQCNLVDCLFRMINLKDTRFEDSKLRSCDFYGASLVNVAFPGSAFEGLGFDNCRLTNVDMSEAAELLVGDPSTLRGVSVSDCHVPLLATVLAEHVGIVIVDDQMH